MAKSIVAYGCYLPFLRLKREEYLNALGSCGAEIREKAVMDVDEDVITMAVEAARNATAGLNTAEVGVLAMASTNFPCQEKFMAGTVIEALGLKSDVLTSHHGYSGLAGAEAFLTAVGMLDQTDRRLAVVVISDAPAAGVFEEMDHGLGAAACAFVLAKDQPGLEFEGVCTHAAEYMGLRYRLPGETTVRDIGVRAYSSQAFNETIRAAVSGLLNQVGRSPTHYRHLVLPQTDVKASFSLAEKMGFGASQLTESLVFDQVGDAGCCSPFLGLCKALEGMEVGDRALLCSYGAGSGSYALSFGLTGGLLPTPKPVGWQLNRKKYINYMHYLKLKKVYVR